MSAFGDIIDDALFRYEENDVIDVVYGRPTTSLVLKALRRLMNVDDNVSEAALVDVYVSRDVSGKIAAQFINYGNKVLVDRKEYVDEESVPITDSWVYGILYASRSLPEMSSETVIASIPAHHAYWEALPVKQLKLLIRASDDIQHHPTKKHQMATLLAHASALSTLSPESYRLRLDINTARLRARLSPVYAQAQCQEEEGKMQREFGHGYDDCNNEGYQHDGMGAVWQCEHRLNSPFLTRSVSTLVMRLRMQYCM